MQADPDTIGLDRLAAQQRTQRAGEIAREADRRQVVQPELSPKAARRVAAQTNAQNEATIGQLADGGRLRRQGGDPPGRERHHRDAHAEPVGHDLGRGLPPLDTRVERASPGRARRPPDAVVSEPRRLLHQRPLVGEREPQAVVDANTTLHTVAAGYTSTRTTRS